MNGYRDRVMMLVLMCIGGCRKDSPASAKGFGAAETSVAGAHAENGRPEQQSKLRGMQIAVSTTHACSITADQRVHCWGSNTHGELGNGSHTASFTTPVPVRGLTEVTRIAVDAHASCAVTRNGNVWCWGIGDMLGRGNASHPDVAVPHQVPGITTAKEIALENRHAAVALGDGSVACWGDNTQNACGRDSMSEHGAKRVEWPSTVPGISRATRVGLGDGGGCALRTDRDVQCWGRLAQMSARNSEQIEMGGSKLCVRASGSIWGCATRTAADPRQIVPGDMPTAKALSVDDSRSFGVGQDDSVVVFGDNSFEIGPKRVTIPKFTNAFRVAHSATHVCTLDRSGDAHCAGLWSDDLTQSQYDGTYELSFPTQHDDTRSDQTPAPELPPGRIVVPTYAKGVVLPDGVPVTDQSIILPGDTVQVLWNNQAWYEAWVLEVLPSGVRVEYNDRSKQTVARSSIRQGPIHPITHFSQYDGPQVDANTTLQVGSKVYVRETGQWSPATVLSLADTKAIVHLDGFSETQQMTVTRTSLRLPKP